MLSLYYGIGEYVSENSREGFWGTEAIKTISERLRKELPQLRGCSDSSIKNMRTFYEEWSLNLFSCQIDCEDVVKEGVVISIFDTPSFDIQFIQFIVLQIRFQYISSLLHL